MDIGGRYRWTAQWLTGAWTEVGTAGGCGSGKQGRRTLLRAQSPKLAWAPGTEHGGHEPLGGEDRRATRRWAGRGAEGGRMGTKSTDELSVNSGQREEEKGRRVLCVCKESNMNEIVGLFFPYLFSIKNFLKNA